MPSTAVSVAELITGQRMDAGEFMRRWQDLPDLKRAELIDGIVHVPSPLSLDHGRRDLRIGWWLTQYADATPGCECASNCTWLMRDNVPQPDCYLRILPAKGGQSRTEGRYPAGAPELIVETCLSSTEVDFGPKLDLYRHAGVREYVTVEILKRRILWRALDGDVYLYLDSPADGIYRSQTFPGLWLDVAAFWDDDGPRMQATLNAGLATADHARFAARLTSTP